MLTAPCSPRTYLTLARTMNASNVARTYALSAHCSRHHSSYSVQCLAKVLTPSNPRFEEYLAAAMEGNAMLEPITYVLKKHAGDESLLEAAADCLAAVATRPAYSNALIETGCVQSFLASALANPNAAASKRALKMIDELSLHAPDKLTASGTLELLADSLGSSEAPEVLPVEVMRALERMNRVDGTATTMMQNGLLKIAVETVSAQANAKPADYAVAAQVQANVEICLRMLDRASRDEAIAKYLQEECGGLNLISRLLKTQASDDTLYRLGGQVLGKLARGSIQSIVTKLNTTTDPAEKASLANVMSTLALEDEHVDKIVASGGIRALCVAVQSTNVKSASAAASALARIAAGSDTTSLNDQEVLEQLTSTLRVHAGQADVLAPTARAISRLDLSKFSLDSVQGLTAQLELLDESSMPLPDTVLSVLDAMTNVAMSGIMNASAALRAALNACSRHAHSPEVLSSAVVLINCALQSEELVLEWETRGGLPALRSMLQHVPAAGMPDVLHLIGTVGMVASMRLKMQDDGVLAHVCQALERAGSEVPVAVQLQAMQAVASDQIIPVLLEALKAIAAAGGMQVGSAEQLAVRGCHNLSASLSWSRSLMQAPDMLNLFDAALQRVLGRSTPAAALAADELFGLLLKLVTCLSLDSALRRQVLQHLPLMRTLLSALNTPGQTLASMASLSGLAQVALSDKQVLLELGSQLVGNALLSLIRSQVTKLPLASLCMPAVRSICCDPEAEVAFCVSGGAKVLASLLLQCSEGSNVPAGLPGAGIRQLYSFLQRPSLLDSLRKQDVVPAVLAVMPQLTAVSAYQAAQLLGALMAEADVGKLVVSLQRVATDVEAMAAGEQAAAAMVPMLTTVASLCSAPEHRAQVHSANGATLLARIGRAAIQHCAPAERDGVLKSCLTALSCLAEVDAANAAQVVDMSMLAIETGACQLQALRACSSASLHWPAAVPGERVMSAVSSVLDSLKHEEPVVAAAFQLTTTALASPALAQAVVKAGVLQQATQWLDDNAFDAQPEHIMRALTMLSSEPALESTQAFIQTPSGVDVVRNLLTRCSNLEQGGGDVLGSLAGALQRCSTKYPTVLVPIHAAGVLRRTVKACLKLQAEGSAEAVLGLLHSAASQQAHVDDAAHAKQMETLQAMAISVMDTFSSSEPVSRAGSAMLSSIGSGKVVATNALQSLQAQLSAVPSAPDMVDVVSSRIKVLNTVLLADGVITEANREDLLNTLVDSLDVLSNVDNADAKAIPIGLSAISKVLDAGAPSGPLLIACIADAADAGAGDLTTLLEAVRVMAKAITTPETLQAFQEVGGFDKMQAAQQQLSAKDIQPVTALLAKRMLQAVMDGPEYFESMAGGGSCVLRAMIFAASTATERIAMVRQVAQSEHGELVLWCALESLATEASAAPMDLLAPLLQHLGTFAELHASHGFRVPSTHDRVKAVLAVTHRAHKAASSVSAASVSNAQNLDVLMQALGLLGSMQLEPEDAHELVAGGELETLLVLLDNYKSRPAQLQPVLAALSNLLEADSAAAAKLAWTGLNNDALAQSLLCAVQAPHPVIMGLVLGVANTLVATDEGQRTRLNRAFQAVVEEHASVLQAEHPDACTSLLDVLQVRLHDAAAAELTDVLRSSTSMTAVAALESAVELEELAVVHLEMEEEEVALPDDTVLSVRSSEGYTAVKAAMMSAKQVADTVESDSVMAVDDTAVRTVLRSLQIGAKIADKEMVDCTAQVLRRLIQRPENVDLIERMGGTAAVLAALRKDPGNAELLSALLDVLERLSRSADSKSIITARGGMDVVIAAIYEHAKSVPIVTQCLAILANVAYASELNIACFMELDGVKAVEFAMQQHEKEPRLLENAMCVLSNVMFGSEDNKLVVGQTCGDEVVRIIEMFAEDGSLVRMAMRAIGNMCFCDDNIRYIVCEHAGSRAIVKAGRIHVQHEETLSLALDVLGNFASLEEDPDDLLEGQRTAAEHMLDDQAASFICDTVLERKMNTAVVAAGVNALANLAANSSVCERVGEATSCPTLCVDIMQMHDWDDQLMQAVLPLAGALSFAPAVSKFLVQSSAVGIVLDVTLKQLKLRAAVLGNAILTHQEQEEQLELIDTAASAGLACLANLALQPDCLEATGGQRLVDGLMECLDAATPDDALLIEVLDCLVRMTSNPVATALLVELGLSHLMRVSRLCMVRPDPLQHCFRLQSHLCAREEYVSALVQRNALVLLMEAVATHPSHRDLMLRAVRTIDSIALASTEHCQLVIESGGRETVTIIMDAYLHDLEIQAAGKSALLAFDALDSLGNALAPAKRNLAELQAKAKSDPLAEYRHFLTAGQVLKLWMKQSNAKPVHLLVSGDCRSIVWQEPTGLVKRKLGALDLGSVQEIKPERGQFHKKRAPAECCFTVHGERLDLCLETTTTSERDRWVDALKQLFRVFTEQPESLVQ